MFKPIDDTWSWDLLDMNDYGPKNIKDYKCKLVVTNCVGQFL